MTRPDPNHLKTHLDPAKSIAILLPHHPSLDAVATALSFKLTLEAKAKQVTVVCPDPMTVEFNRLVGVESITHQFGNSNLIISFHHQSDLVDTVSYDMDQGNLRLIITPKKGITNLDYRQLKFTPATNRADILVTIDVPRLEDLGEIHTTASDVIKSSPMLSLNHQPPQLSFATVHLSHPDSSSLSEMAAHLLDGAGYPLDEDVATNLYQGLTSATDHFKTGHITHETFETAALLLRRGARQDRSLVASDFPPGSIPNKPLHEEPIQVTTPDPQPSSTLGYGTDSQTPSETTATKPANPPNEWLEPKIYRGPMLQ